MTVGDEDIGGSTGGGGMSRAAKKRAKAKQKQNNITINDSTTTDASNSIQVDDATTSKNNNKRKFKTSSNDDNKKKKITTIDKTNHQQTDSRKSSVKNASNPDNDDDDDDEIVDMKDAALNPVDDGMSDNILPNDCSSLIEILLVNDVDDDGNDDVLSDEDDGNDDDVESDVKNDDPKTMTTTSCQYQLREMTAKCRAQCVLEFLLRPASISVNTFYETYWEKRPLCIRAPGLPAVAVDSENNTTIGRRKNDQNHRTRLDGFLSEHWIHEMIQNEKLYHVRDISIVRYEKGLHDGIVRAINLDPRRKTPTTNNDDDVPNCFNNNNVDDNNIVSNIDLDELYVPIDPNIVWKQYTDDNCTIRLLCPLQNNPTIHSLLSLLELEFGCRVGVDATLQKPATAQQPKESPPRYDGIEAFHLQLQGHQRWKVYEPINKSLRLPRSGGTCTDDLREVKPMIDVVLQSGDVLYIPRGFIYQTCALNSENEVHNDISSGCTSSSLHMTISAMQQWAWVDLLEILLPEAISAAAASSTSTSLRQGLPIRFLDYMGAMHDNYRDETLPEPLKMLKNNASQPTSVTKTMMASSRDDGNNEYNSGSDNDSEGNEVGVNFIKQLQEEFRLEAKKKIMRVAKEATDILDAACDQMAIRFLSDRVPPALTPLEKMDTIAGENCNDNGNHTPGGRIKILPNTLCRIVRPGIARLVLEDVGTKAILYHCIDNALVYHESPLNPMEFELDDAPAIEQLLTTTEPHWICVADLYHDSIEDKVGITQALFDEGILSIRSTDL